MVKRIILLSLIVGAVLVPTAATAGETETVTWSLSEQFNDHTEQELKGLVNTDHQSLFPQTLGAICGRWLQIDTYSQASEKEIQWLTDIVADGQLVYGEDFGLVVSWRFVKADPCVEETTTTTEPEQETTTTTVPESTTTVVEETSTTVAVSTSLVEEIVTTTVASTTDDCVDDGECLPLTGASDLVPFAIVGGLLLVLGSATLHASRRSNGGN